MATTTPTTPTAVETAAARFQQTHLTDVAIVADGHRFWVSKVLMAHFSPVFERMFYGAFRESRDAEITFPEKSAEDIVELLMCLVPCPDLKEIDWENVCVLYTLSEEYQIVWLKQRCSEFLRWQTAELEEGDDQLLDALILASWLGAEPEQLRLLPKVARLADDKISYEQLQLLPPAVLAAYYQAKVNKARSRLSHILSAQETLGHCQLHSHYAGKVRKCVECQQTFCDQHGRTTACKCATCGKLVFPNETTRVECHCSYDYDRQLLGGNNGNGSSKDDGPMDKRKFMAMCRHMIGPAYRRAMAEEQSIREEQAVKAAKQAAMEKLLSTRKKR